MAHNELEIDEIITKPFPGMILKSNGIRKSVDVFQGVNYIENLTQSILSAISCSSGTFLIGGDGRSFTEAALERAVKVCAGNQIPRILVPVAGLLTMSVASCLLKEYFCHAALVFTSGSTAPEERENFGLKVMIAPGIPPASTLVKKANVLAEIMESYLICKDLSLNLKTTNEIEYLISGRMFTIRVIDPVKLYAETLEKMFDFPPMKDFFKRSQDDEIEDQKAYFNCSHGAAIPFMRHVFVKELDFPKEWLINSSYKNSYSTCSMDKDFMQKLQTVKPLFGATVSYDGCRYTIFGEGAFNVTPSDSLAIIAQHSEKIPFFKNYPLKMVVRSMCTSQAVDKWAQHASIEVLEVVPGWANFHIALLPNKKESILYGEESSGLGINSFGDRDGIWAVLAWLTILVETKQSVKSILQSHWQKFGRAFFKRIDFEKIESSLCEDFIRFLRKAGVLRLERRKVGLSQYKFYLAILGLDAKFQNQENEDEQEEDAVVTFKIENYIYPFGFLSEIKDPCCEVFQIKLCNEARIIIRKSENTYQLNTIRMYVEYIVDNLSEQLLSDAETVLAPFIEVALEITTLNQVLG